MPGAAGGAAMLGPALAIARKDIRQLLRDRVGFFFTFAFPLVVAVFFGSVFGGGGGGTQAIDVDLVDLDGSDGSRAFVKELEAGDDLAVNPVASRDEAVDRVQRGDAGAAVIIPKGFGEARAAPFSGAPMELEVAIDPSRQATAGMLEGILTKYGYMQMQAAFQHPEKMRTLARDSLRRLDESKDVDPARKLLFRTFFGNLDAMLGAVPPAQAAAGDGGGGGKAGAAGWQPLRIERTSVARKRADVPDNAYAITFPQGIMWGVMGCCLSFAIGLVLERSRGTLMRLRVAPIPPMSILLGKALACFAVTTAVSWLLVGIGVGVFGIRPISYPHLVVALLCTSACFVGIMNLLAALSPSERAASGLGWGVLIVLAMIGGVMIPIDLMPIEWLRRASMISPMRWALLAVQAGVWRDLPADRFALACGVLLTIGGVGFGAGVRAFGSLEGRA